MEHPRIFISYKGLNADRMEEVYALLKSFGACPKIDKEFIRDGESYLDRIPDVLKQEADALIALVTEEMDAAPLQCKRELDSADLLHIPVYCIRYGTSDVDRGLMYPAMNADWIWIKDAEDREAQASAVQRIVSALQNGTVHPADSDTYAVLLDQGNDYLPKLKEAPLPVLPSPFFEEILPLLDLGNNEKKTLPEYFLSGNHGGCIVVTGEGGGGKSTSMKHLAHLLRGTDAYPVYIPVRQLNAGKYAGPHPVLRYIGEEIFHLRPDTVNIPSFLKDLFTALCPKYPIVFLADGLNEASGTADVTADLQSLCGIPGASVCITSRNSGSLRNRPGIHIAEALPLSDEQLRVLQHNHPVRILTDLNERILDLMRNPLLLTMMINAYDRVDYEELIAEDFSDYTLADVIRLCISAQLKRPGYRSDYEVQTDIQILIPVTMAYLFMNGRLKDSVADEYEFSDALSDMVNTVLEPLGNRLRALIGAGRDTDDEEQWRLYTVDYISDMKENPRRFSDMQAIRSVGFLKNTLKFLEDTGNPGEIRWTHQTVADWFIAEGISILCRIAAMKKTPAAEAAYDLSEQWLKGIASHINEQREDPLYDDCTEIGELVYGLLKDSYVSRGYRDLLIRVSNAHGLHKTSNACRITLSALKHAQIPYEDMNPELEPEAYMKLTGLTASAAFGLCHTNGGLPDGMSETDILDIAEKTFYSCLERLNHYPSETAKQKRKIRFEDARFHTLVNAALIRKSDLCSDPVQKRNYVETVLKSSKEILEKRLLLQKDILADPEADDREKAEIRKQVPLSLTTIASTYWRMKEYEQAVAYHSEALRLRREMLKDPSCSAVFSQVRNGVNENRVRILGCLARIPLKDPDALKERFAEYRATADYAADNHFYKELNNICDNFRTQLRQIGTLEDMDEQLYAETAETARYLTEKYNSQSRIPVNLENELPSFAVYAPSSDLPIEEQIAGIKHAIARYIYSARFRQLLGYFGFAEEMTGDIGKDLPVLNLFVERWDYRKGRERQQIQNGDPTAQKYRDEIIETADRLGMMRQVISHITEADFILVLGGANLSNRTRCITGKDILENVRTKEVSVIALGSQRALPPEEKQRIRDFAPDAETEFDAIVKGMENTFGLKETERKETDDSGGIFLQWKSTGSHRYYALCTPSVNGKRANTRDTFEHFLNVFQVKEKAEVALATTALYCNYQLLCLLPTALEHGIHLSVAGREVPVTTALSAEYFLQEIKAAVNAMNTFMAWAQSSRF